MLDTAKGHKKWTPILSVRFVRETFGDLHLERIDPSDSLQNFVHEMKFQKTRGMQPIVPLSLEGEMQKLSSS